MDLAANAEGAGEDVTAMLPFDAHLLSYDGKETGNRPMTERAAWQADEARRIGVFKTITTMTPADYQGTTFAQIHAATLAVPRGAGLWLWKPYIVMKRLSEVAEGDVVLYLDADIAFAGDPMGFIRIARDQGMAIFGYGPDFSNRRFTKRSCLRALRADCEPWLSMPQVWAAAMAVRRCVPSLMLLTDWLTGCCLPGILELSDDGVEQHPGYQEHRSDQSVLSIAVARHGIKPVPNEMAGLFAHPPC